MKLLLSLSLLILANVCLAQTNSTPSAAQTTNQLPDKITVDGVTYEKVRWQKPTPASVEIFHKSGVATIPLEKLPKELQERFGYDAQKAAAYRKAQAEQLESQRQQQELARHEAEERKHKVLSAIAKRQEQESLRQQEITEARANEEAAAARAELYAVKIQQALPKGCIGRMLSESERYGLSANERDFAFYVEGLTDVYDDSVVTIVIERQQEDFEYTTVLGAYRKLPRFRYLGRPEYKRTQTKWGWEDFYYWQGRQIFFARPGH